MSDAGGQSEHRVRLGDLEMWFELSIEILESLSYSIQSEDSPLFSGIIDHSLLLRMDDLTGRFESDGFSQILKDLKTVNEQHISSGQHATRVEGTTYCLAAEALQALLKAVHSKLVLISERLDSGAVRYHINGLSSIGINEPVLEALRELFYQQMSSYWRREDLDRQEKFDSLSKDIELLTEKFKAGAERGQVLKWTDAEEAVNMTKADYEFPESLNQEVIDERERDTEYARLSRINKAQIEVSTFTEEDPHQDFYRGFSQRIAALGQVLKAEKVARHLVSIQSDWPKQWQKDAFQHAVQIYQTAVSGDAEEVKERLESLSQATESGDERSQKAKREFRDFVYLALRHEVMLKLRIKAFCSPQNMTQGTSNAQNAKNTHLISEDHSDHESNDGYTIGQLIRDLSEYRDLRNESENNTRKQGGQAALKGTLSAHYAVQAAICSKNAHNLFSRIPDDVIDLIRPLCEASGKFDVETLKPLRAKLCLYLDETQSFVDSMSPSEFRRLTLMRIGQRPDGVEPFQKDLKSINDGLTETRETPTQTPKFNIPAGIDSDQSQTSQKNEGPKLEERFEKAYQSYQLAEIRLEKCTDKEAYEWLTENGPGEYAPPPLETWLRYVRAGRKHYGANKNSPLAGRSGRSIVGPEG
ncbi:MAG TPA: hypothetical protein DCY03_05105 [Planctomycetaceae bacterium]|nr:hypothetical protein [Planctomycetaceae bacterium]|tara:strand:+ start:4791 stop:6719 length:1929 start_codon:yes stop_codon:yes gene_type:complete